MQFPWNAPWNQRRFRLYRDPAHGILAGVCAGIAGYFGTGRMPVRLVFLVALVVFFIPTALGYVVLAYALKPRPPALYADAEEESFWRGVATAPDDTFTTLRRKFGDLERRLRALETQVTSTDFDLRRKFNDLGR